MEPSGGGGVGRAQVRTLDPPGVRQYQASWCDCITTRSAVMTYLMRTSSGWRIG